MCMHHSLCDVSAPHTCFLYTRFLHTCLLHPSQPSLADQPTMATQAPEFQAVSEQAAPDGQTSRAGESLAQPRGCPCFTSRGTRAVLMATSFPRPL